jgi:hypothetical protein
MDEETKAKIAAEIEWLKSNVRPKEEGDYSDWIDTCPRCGSTNTGSSPTGWWCNDCGLMSPCPCWRGDHLGCIEAQNKIRRKSGLPPVIACCCSEGVLIKEEKTDNGIIEDRPLQDLVDAARKIEAAYIEFQSIERPTGKIAPAHYEVYVDFTWKLQYPVQCLITALRTGGAMGNS